MYQLDADELITVLRALNWYENKLLNVDEKYRDNSALDSVIVLRVRLGNRLKYEAMID